VGEQSTYVHALTPSFCTSALPSLQGALYARYRPEKLLEHLKLFSTRINIPRLIRSVIASPAVIDLTWRLCKSLINPKLPAAD
jgi:hypothetical protein